MKVYELAKQLNRKSSEVMSVLKELGVEIKSANTSLTEEQEDMIRAEFVELKTVAETVAEVAPVTAPVVEAPKRKTDADYRPDEMIPCRSVFAGTLIFTGDHTGMSYTFNGMGDRRMIEYQDLKAGMLQQKPSMYKPKFIIEDADLINDVHWVDIKDVYEKMYDQKDLEKILELPNSKFRETYTTLPITAKETIITIVATRIENGTFENYNKAKIIDEISGTRFDLKMM